MKRMISILLFVCVTFNVFAQDEDLKRYDDVMKQIVENINSQNYEKIWNSYTKERQKRLQLEFYLHFMNNYIKVLGNVNEYNYIEKGADLVVYKVQFENAIKYFRFGKNENNEITGLAYLDEKPIIYPGVNSETTIDDLANPYISDELTVGLAIGVIDNGEVSTYFYGETERGNNIKPNGDTIFEIASITKVFTGILMAEMENEGLIYKNDPVKKYLPDTVSIPAYDGKEITLENLVTHTSTLPRVQDDFSKEEEADYTFEDLYKYLSGLKLDRKIGETYEYSNLGFGLLGHTLALRAEIDYANMLVEKICNPLNMNDTRIYLSKEQKKSLAQGYSNKGEPAKHFDAITHNAAGGINSSINDLVKFLFANLSKNKTQISKAIQKSHETLFKDGYSELAYAWFVVDLDGEKILDHNGGTSGFSSYLAFSEDAQNGVVVLSNSAIDVTNLGSYIMELLSLDSPKQK